MERKSILTVVFSPSNRLIFKIVQNKLVGENKICIRGHYQKISQNNVQQVVLSIFFVNHKSSLPNSHFIMGATYVEKSKFVSRPKTTKN